MKINLFSVLKHAIYLEGLKMTLHDVRPVISLEIENKEIEVKSMGQACLFYRAYEFVIRWPIIIQLQLHVPRYEVGGFLCEHVDTIQKGECQYRIQVMLEHPVRGGELICEQFIVNRKWLKIFEPGRFKHQVTEVKEGRRRLLNFGIRIAPRSMRPFPF